VSAKDIRTSSVSTMCDVCGRTLLRGERSAVYLNGGSRKSVCELCESRVLQEGWVREGTVPPVPQQPVTTERRPSLLGRRRTRRARERGASRPTLADELDGRSWAETGDSSDGLREFAREPRHVRAVPTSAEHKVASAIELFNSSEHRRTVAGIARSLGAPVVAVVPSMSSASTVNLTVSWELCWYRYEVDLSDDQPSVRVVTQGSELEELAPEELQPTASCDSSGSLMALGVE
jgi:hypothetical protein